MNVCLLINSFNLGGAEKLMYDVSQVLKNRGINVYLVAMKQAETELEKTVFAMLNNAGIQVDSIGKPVGTQKGKAILSIRQFLKKHRIDILHTNGPSPDFYGRLATVLYPKSKTVVTFHSTGRYRRKIEQLLKGLTGAYTAVSNQAAEYAEQTLGVKKVFVIDNGIDFDRYKKGQKNSDEYRILSVGRVVPEKGYRNVVAGICDYLNNHPDAYWYIVGETAQNPEYFSEVSALIDKAVRERIIFTGAVTNPEDYYKSADCFLLPSEYEGFGIAYVEAMAAKLPVICNKVGVILDIEKNGGSVVELNPQDMTSCIEKANNITTEQIEFNYEFCKKNYSVEAKTEQYIEIYQSLSKE